MSSNLLRSCNSKGFAWYASVSESFERDVVGNVGTKKCDLFL